MNQETKIIPYDSPEAAEQVTVTLWKASNGCLCYTESAARFTGCTHRPCEKCGELTEKSYTICLACREIADAARWKERPRKPWDGKQMVYSDLTDEYYESPGDALDANEPYTLEELRLVLCEPEFASINEDHFTTITPDDHDLPKEVLSAIEAFNKAVAGVECCWNPGKYAMEIEQKAEVAP